MLTVEWPKCILHRGFSLIFDEIDPVHGHVVNFNLEANYC